jgi:type IX secretion system PorP/SprF family membrane protein
MINLPGPLSFLKGMLYLNEESDMRLCNIHLKISFLSLFLTCSLLARGQSDSSTISLGYPVYSQYLQNGLMINPAYTGTRGALSTFLSYRIQWMSMPGSPRIQSVSLHTPMKNDKVALGLLAQFMNFGSTRSSSVYGSYAYHIRFKTSRLSFGMKAGFDRSATDYSDVRESLSRFTNQTDPVFNGNDKPYMLPNIGAGVYFSGSRVFAGLSVPSFLSYNRTSTGKVEAFHSFRNYDFVFSGGGLVTFSQFFKFKPSFLVNYSLNSSRKFTQLDLNGNFIFADILWLGGSWRTTEQVVVGILQFQVNPQLMVGFSYDYAAGRMKPFNTGGSSEFILRYEFGYKVSASNPRYF